MVSDKMCHYERTVEFGKSYPETNYWNLAYNIEPLFKKIQKYLIESKGQYKMMFSGNHDPLIMEWKGKMIDAVDLERGGTQAINLEEKTELLWTMFKFYASNKRVFRLTNNLAIAMDNTNVNDFMGYANIPYDSIYLLFPQEYFKYRRMAKLDDMRMPWASNEASQWIKEAKGEISGNCDVHPKFVDLELAGIKNPDEIKRVFNGNRPEGVYLDIENNQLNMQVVLKPHNYRHSIFYESTYRMSIEINGDKSIKNIINSTLEKFELNSDTSIEIRDGHDFVLNSTCSIDKEYNYTEFIDRQKAKKEEIKSIIILTLKTLAYMNSANQDIHKVGAPSKKIINKKKFKKHPGRTKSRLPFYIIGDDIKIDNKSTSGGESTGTRGSLTTRFMVRGHYHHFWKKRTEETTDNMVVKTDEDGKVLVRKWLAPFWKGPEYGDVILKNYKVT